jgi:hypothetical protein
MSQESIKALLEVIDGLEERIAAARTECEIWASSDVEQKAYQEAQARLRALERELERLHREAFIFVIKSSATPGADLRS